MLHHDIRRAGNQKLASDDLTAVVLNRRTNSLQQNSSAIQGRHVRVISLLDPAAQARPIGLNVDQEIAIHDGHRVDPPLNGHPLAIFLVLCHPPDRYPLLWRDRAVPLEGYLCVLDHGGRARIGYTLDRDNLARLEGAVARGDGNVDPARHVLNEQAGRVVLMHEAGDHRMDSNWIASGGLLGCKLSDLADRLE